MRFRRPTAARFPWEPASTYVARPPFAAMDQGSRLGNFTAYPLLVLGDDMTTDHIPPAGQISTHSYAGEYLISEGDPPDDLNVYASRRGNWKTMIRGLFDNGSAANHLVEGAPARHTVHGPSGQRGPLWEVAQRYRSERLSSIIVAGERYGAGSSRDWAAKGAGLLGVRAILAQSFERIHRSNLVGMGVLPIEMPSDFPAAASRLRAEDQIAIIATSISPRCLIPVELLKTDGARERFIGRAAVETDLDVKLLTSGGMIPHILAQRLRRDGCGLS